MTPEQKIDKLKEIQAKMLENKTVCVQAFGQSSSNPNEALKNLCIATNMKVFEAEVKKVLES